MTTPQGFEDARTWLLAFDDVDGLPPLADAARLGATWRWPSFSPWQSWTLLRRRGAFEVRRRTWVQPQGPLRPARCFVAMGRVEASVAAALVESFDASWLRLDPQAASWGIDGTTCGVLVPDAQGTFSQLSWWSQPPEAWAPIVTWHDRATAALERFLPSGTTDDAYPQVLPLGCGRVS
ncbi:MAG: hypothetical protein H6733_11675 [Alphaproteobacteria bacterium]|nr:hypothetical protein [Alphaproteobacteria bacterium]